MSAEPVPPVAPPAIPAVPPAGASPGTDATRVQTDEEVDAALPKGRTCRCGHDRTSHMVSPSGEYTFFGWCMILVGISADPVAIRWACRRCQEEVYRTTDKAIIKRTRLFG
jgi:hypothetical protein